MNLRAAAHRHARPVAIGCIVVACVVFAWRGYEQAGLGLAFGSLWALCGH